jgi:hypothetical protein
VDPVTVTTKVYPTAAHAMFLPSGEIGQEADRLRYWAQASARKFAPSRTGALRRTIWGDRKGSNQYQARFTVYTTSPYGLYVDQGTTGPIVGNGNAMVLYQGPRIVPARYAHTAGWLVPNVRGQRAQRFLERGLQAAMVRFGY